MKTYLFSYSWNGAQYTLEIPAESSAEAQYRAMAIQSGGLAYDGELMSKIPASAGGWLPRLITWWKNL